MLTFSLSAAATITYSGTLSFPTGSSATASTSSILIIAENPLNITQNQILSVPFLPGQASTNYTITLPDNGHNWRLRYSCTLCNSEGILTEGFYASSGSVTQASNATVLAGSASQTGINIDLLTGLSISGQISFPAGQSATALSNSILIIAENPLNIAQSQILSVNFTVGQSSLNYTVTVPDNGHDWRIRYQCTLCNQEGIITEGFYSSSGTVTSSSSATNLAGGIEHSGINLQLLIGRTIEGQLSFPAGLSANSQSRTILILAENPLNITQNQILTVPFTIGQNSRSYSITVPDNGHDWRISYLCSLCNAQGILTEGYYSDSGTVTSPNQATILSGTINHTGIDISLTEGRTIAGTISFPTGESATNQTSTILVIAENPLNITQSEILAVNFTVGQSNRDYSITIPDNGHDWRIRYQCSLCNAQGILTEGYYSANGTVSTAQQATALSGEINHTNINLDLLLGLRISGELSFPAGISATAQTRNVLVVAENPLNITQNQILTVTFSLGQRRQNYAISIPSNGHDWRVRYVCSLCNAIGVITEGYYSAAGTVSAANNATILSGATSSSGINIPFLGLSNPSPAPEPNPLQPTITPVLQLLLLDEG